MSSTITNEQPVSKRQRIDSVNQSNLDNDTQTSTNDVQLIFNTERLTTNSINTPPDILPTSITASATATATIATTTLNLVNFNENDIFISNQQTEQLPIKDRCDSDELDNVAITRGDNFHSNGHHDISADFPDLLKNTNATPTTSLILPAPSSSLSSSLQSSLQSSPSSSSAFPATVSASTSTSTSISSLSSLSSSSVTANLCGDLHIYPNNSPSCSYSNNLPSCSYSNNSPSCSKTNETNDSKTNVSILNEFQVHLSKQCLCRVSEQTLQRPFEGHYYKDNSGEKHSLPLNEWPIDELIQFLSNMQLLFDVYLKQNARGLICSRIMKLCNALVNTEYSIIDEILMLHEYNNKFVQFLAGRVIASCMVIAKDKQDCHETWLTTLVSLLTVNPGEYAAMQRVAFSLEIILRILEWVDIEEHPLEDALAAIRQAVESDEEHEDENFTLPLVVPPIENNYFAVHFNEDVGPDATQMLSTTASNALHDSTPTNNDEHSPASNSLENSSDASTCHLETLADAESFDTSTLKCNIVSALKIKWSVLVESMGDCISHTECNDHTENTILTFLTLWQRIISIQTNLSVVSTLPFHAKLTTFLDILIRGNLSVAVYKQILTLFNESLCYGTTLALQAVLPEETSRLANEIFNGVKTQRIFNSLPVQHAEPENDISFIGYRNPTITYSSENCPRTSNNDINNEAASGPPDVNRSMDFILVQKLVLLILQAIAVTVKPVRGEDSSDSSMDGCSSNSSTDYEAYQATVQIERATRDVLRKLSNFMRNKLNHHPETHFSKMVLHLFADQDDYLIEAMVCVLDTTTAFLPRQTVLGNLNVATRRNQFNVLINILCPVYSFLEFLELISNKPELLLDFLMGRETCFLLYLLRFLKYVRGDWQTFHDRCNDWVSADNAVNGNRLDAVTSVLDRAMAVLIRLRLLIERLVLQSLYPYDITPIVVLLRQCESLYEGNDPFSLV